MHLKIFKYVFINVLLICFTNISYAQTYPVYKNSSAIAVLDQDALFSESEWGKEVLKNVEKKVSKLSDENRSIETALELEESELTKIRKTISKIEFDVLAIKFDEKVKKIRLEQADKQRKINIFLNENRKLFFKLAIYNFNRFIYPREKLEWIIVDNGEENLCDILPIDNRIRYIKLDHSKQYSVAYMRNRCISESKHDIICYMDDDDIYRPESILSRVKSLIKYKNNGIECVGCTQIGCFNIINGHDDEEKVIEVQHEEIDEDEYPLGI